MPRLVSFIDSCSLNNAYRGWISCGVFNQIESFAFSRRVRWQKAKFNLSQRIVLSGWITSDISWADISNGSADSGTVTVSLGKTALHLGLSGVAPTGCGAWLR